jgi:hypothetical protein
MLHEYYWSCDSYSANRRSATNKKEMKNSVLVLRMHLSLSLSAALHIKGTVVRDFWTRFFSWIYSIWASDFEAKRIFFSFSFSRSYSNTLMNPRCRLLRGFKNIFLRIPKLMVKFDRYKVQLFTTCVIFKLLSL